MRRVSTRRAVAALALPVALVAGCGLVPSNGLAYGTGEPGVGIGTGFSVGYDLADGEESAWVGLETLCAYDDATEVVGVTPVVASGGADVEYLLRTTPAAATAVGLQTSAPDGLVPADGATVPTRCGAGGDDVTQLVAHVTTDEGVVLDGYRLAYFGDGGRRELRSTTQVRVGVAP